MAEFISVLQEIQQQPPELHLFCPKSNDDDLDRYEEDVDGKSLADIGDADRLAKISQAQTRRSKFMSSLQLLAYDGQESEQYQRFIWDSLDTALGRCDVCIRNYYIAKLKFLANLREEYEETDIVNFFALINRRDISRITQGLSGAATTLRNLPEQKRGTSALDKVHLHAIFEALICEAFLSDESLLAKHFDEPFRLIQSKKPLRIREVLPATVRFLFDKNTRRLDWANQIWNRIERSPTDIEWTWAIKDILQLKLQHASESQEISRLWSAMALIVSTLDETLITHNLFDLVPNICTTALNHLAKRTHAVPLITRTMMIILQKAPAAFWQAMGSISSQTFVEQVFASPLFNKYLQDAAVAEDAWKLDVLSWAPIFLQSLKPGNRPAACQSLVNQLFDRIHDQTISAEARTKSFEMAVKIILQTTVAFSDNEKNRQSVERLVLSDTLNTISHRIAVILNPKDLVLTAKLNETTRTDIMSVVRNSLALECQNLKSDFETLAMKEPLRHESSSYSPDIWNAVIANLADDNEPLSTAALLGIMALPGLEQFRVKDNDGAAKAKRSYNSTFEKITGMVSRILERIAEFSPMHLDRLFKQQDTSMSLIAALFSADQSTYEAAVDLVKNISGESGRKEALAHLIDAFFGVTLFGLCWTLRRIANMKTFASVPRMLKTGMEILDVLCNSTNGKLRRHKFEHRDAGAIQSYWSYQWIALKTVFRQTEPWSLEVHDKPLLTEVCRDAIQYAEALFEQYDLFASVLSKAKPDRALDIPKALLDSHDSTTGSPVKTLDAVAKWLRLRDEYLADTLVKLITKMLYRLKSHVAITSSEGLVYVQAVANKDTIKTILSDNQKAMLVRALEYYLGTQIARPVRKKQTSLRGWADVVENRMGTSTPSSRAESVDEFDDSGIADEDLIELSNRALEPRRPSLTPRDGEKNKVVPFKQQQPQRKKPAVITAKEAAKQALDAKAFIENRKREEAARKQRDREAALILRGKAGIGRHTSEQGSGLSGIGVKGKDHSAGPNSMMVSSESESDSNSDEELFGKIQPVHPTVRSQAGTRKPLQAGPVRKIKQVRSQKDVRARLAPDLSSLHKTILSWDFFAETDLPPNSAKDDYTLVTNTFQTVTDYQKTFEPLLVLEGWQSFRAAREDANFKPFEVRIANSLIVDNFVELNSQMSFAEGKELGLGTGDVVLLSRSKKPESEPDEPHCLGRVKEITRKKGEVQVVYRINASNNSLRPHLNDKATVFGIQILSLTTLEREYGALMALPYYDLCDEIITAKPSPLLDYAETELKPIADVYQVNQAQAKAVKSAIDNDAFTLIQGPPGSGKTKTICALVGAFMTASLSRSNGSAPRLNLATQRAAPTPTTTKKILVCAPSNAAVDELVMRLKDGVKLTNGALEKLSVVRLGRSDAINVNVKDVTLEELVNARLNIAAPKDSKEDIHAVMMEHKATSDELNGLRDKINGLRVKGQPVPPEDEQLENGLKRKRAGLSTKIDILREKQNTASRDADLARKKVQQDILDSAHVLCATLSGSGHEIFQSLNVEFETVIIDEAAQSIELSALIPLKYGCSKCVLVGDPKQLPPTVLSREASKFQYEQSLFARMEKNHKKDVHLLDTQYRMHPEISLFPSRMFYDSRLKDGAGMAQLRNRPWHHSSILAPYRFFDVQGMSQAASKGHSLINIAELNVAMQLYDRLITDVRNYNFKGKIGIITPYKGQLKEMRIRFKQRYGEDITSAIEFNTTDAFQGRESEIIIFSCVRASTKGIGFLNDIRRMNVGLTRAKSSLWVLGNSEALKQGEFWRGLVSDAKSRDLYTDGDILGILRRPLLTEDMMKDDVVMVDDGSSPALKNHAGSAGSIQASRESSTSRQSSAKPEKSPLPPAGIGVPRPQRPTNSVSRSSSSSSVVSNPKLVAVRPPPSSIIPKRAALPPGSRDRSSPSHGISSQVPKLNPQAEPRPGVDGPSGGRFGLNDRATCSICGSDAHFTPNCDNMAARQAQMGNCDRCHEPGHLYASCNSPRCFECGEVGHAAKSCQVPGHLRLTKVQQEEVKRQEAKFEKYRERAREKRAEKQLGEHAAQIPVVRNSALPATVKGLPTASKRVREEDGRASAGPTKAPRVSESSPNTSRASHTGGMSTGNVNHLPSGNPNMGLGGRPPNVGPQQIVRKKKANADDMFMKRR